MGDSGSVINLVRQNLAFLPFFNFANNCLPVIEGQKIIYQARKATSKQIFSYHFLSLSSKISKLESLLIHDCVSNAK